LNCGRGDRIEMQELMMARWSVRVFFDRLQPPERCPPTC
jgi:hypothetical protein